MMHHARAHTHSGERFDPSPSLTLDALAERVRRLSPCSRDPHRFHEEKSELAAELRRLAREWRAA